MHFRSSLVARVAGLVLLSVLSHYSAFAQSFRPAGNKRHYTSDGKVYFRGPRYLTVGAGVSYYNGDLTSSPGDNFISPAINVGLSYRMSPHFVLGGELGFVQIGAHGYVINDYSGQLTTPTQVGFNDNMFTLTGIARYHLVADRSAFAGGVGGAPKVMPFLQTGVGLAVINPTTYQGATRDGNGYPALPLERNDYPGIVGIFPVGAGLTFNLSEEVQASIEANYYFTLTDSLDEIDYRAIDSGSDSFGTLMLKLGYVL